jgi:hypothetical protein
MNAESMLMGCGMFLYIRMLLCAVCLTARLNAISFRAIYLA